MKKKLLLVVFMLVCLVNTCFASNGSALDDEEQIANKVFTALTSKGEYSELVPYLSKGFAQTFTEEKFKEVKGKVNTELGNLKNFKLYTLEKLDKADRVFCVADGSKVPNAEFGFLFTNNDSKVLLNGLVIRPVEAKKQTVTPQAKSVTQSQSTTPAKNTNKAKK